MPPPARISVPVKQPSQVKDDVESNSSPSTSMAHTMKPRVVARRRARGRLNETDSDSEVVREPRSDSDTDTVATSLESQSLSDSETEDEPKYRSRAPSPADPLHVAQGSSSPIALPDITESLFPKRQDWSDLVTDEKENGQADLPIVDFADFSVPEGSTPQPEEDESYPSPRLSQPQRKRSQSRDKAPEDASSSKRNTGFARHAYLQKLNSDPAYVPTVGQFWSHDDRLLDKNLRSLSGWWRGKWQGSGAGRGRGGFGGGRGRGRGGFNNVSGPPDDADDGPWKHDRFGAEQDERRADTSRARGGGQSGDVWKHDLFDATESDLPRKGRRNRRKAPRENDDWTQGSSTRGRGRNSRGGGRGKGQFSFDDGFSSTRRATTFGNNVRPWFAMKPERVWTKQFDGYLYSEADLKPIPAQGLGQGVRIKLPGASSVQDQHVIIRLLLEEVPASAPKEPVSNEPLPPNSIVVKLPSPKSLGKQREVPATDEVTTLNLAPLSAPQPTHSAVLPEPQEYSGWSTGSIVKIPPTSQQLENWSSPVGNVEEHYSPEGGVEQADQVELTHSQPPPPPLQTFPPPFQPSASYGSPYSYTTQGLPLPLGIAYAENGMTYEIATGRAVYLQTPPPPPPQPMQITMYNPQPMPLHHGHHGSVHFVPHASPMSMSPPGFPPLFSLPRQSSRIEIRAPDGEDKDREMDVNHARVASQGRLPGSRLAADAEPFTPATHVQGHAQAMDYYAGEAQQSFDDAQRQQQAMYQQATYYYPIAAGRNNPYGYAQHYPGVDVGQPQQYNSYGQEPYPGGYY
ncbi:hypothetical protein BU17DRAFT_52281 [Hysterangium stoloniferum]|nr:hypothetical protein BU17DRAFT_52281 [Hysterangium stoloniferum]